MRLHTNGTPDRRQTLTPTHIDPNYEEFPCKICGKYVVSTTILSIWYINYPRINNNKLCFHFRIFTKVKSRSAHMKSHRPPDAEPKKPKLDQTVDYGQMMQLKTVATPIQLHRQC